MVVLLPMPPDGHSGGSAGVICMAANPFSHVAALEVSSSSSEDGEEDEDEDGSSSHCAGPLISGHNFLLY